jgi:hypothetical protein
MKNVILNQLVPFHDSNWLFRFGKYKSKEMQQPQPDSVIENLNNKILSNCSS